MTEQAFFRKTYEDSRVIDCRDIEASVLAVMTATTSKDQSTWCHYWRPQQTTLFFGFQLRQTVTFKENNYPERILSWNTQFISHLIARLVSGMWSSCSVDWRVKMQAVPRHSRSRLQIHGQAILKVSTIDLNSLLLSISLVHIILPAL